MKSYHVKSHVGVWLDHTTARFYTYDPDKPSDGFVMSGEIKGPDAFTSSSEKTFNNAKTADRNKFYQDISKRLLDYDEILLFGPGKAQEELNNELMQNPHFRNKRIGIKSENRLTEHQRIAFVKHHFATVPQ